MTAIRDHTRAPVVLLSVLGVGRGPRRGARGRRRGGDAPAAGGRERRLRASPRLPAGRGPARTPTAPPARGRIVTVFSPKGGTGKSATATNLAVSLQGDCGNVLLLDLDVQFGDVAIMLDLDPVWTSTTWPRPPESSMPRSWPDTLEALVGTHVLAAPTRPEEAERLTDGKVGRRARPGPRRLRRDRRRHLAVLPRPDADRARPDATGSSLQRARRPDTQEPAPRAAHARAARVPGRPDPARPQPRSGRRAECRRDQRRRRAAGGLRAAERPTLPGR